MKGWVRTIGLVGVVFLALSPANGLCKEPIKLGVILDLTGFFAETGRSCMDALKMVFDETNEKGGIHGHKIDYKITDDSSSPDRGASLARRFIDVDNVLCIVGPSTSGSALAVLKIAAEEKVPVQGIASSNAMHEGEIAKWYFAFRDNVSTDVGARMLYAKKKGYKKIGLMWVNYEWGRSSKDLAYKLAKEYGLTIVGDVPVERGTAECTAEAAKMKEMNPEMVMGFILTKELAAAARGFAALNWKPVMFATGPPIRPAMQLVDPKLMEGWIIAALANENAPEVVALVNKFKEKYGSTTPSPDFFAGIYDSTNVLVHVFKTMIEKGIPLTRMNLKEGMENFSAGVEMLSPRPRKSPGWGKNPPHILCRAEDAIIARIENEKIVVVE